MPSQPSQPRQPYPDDLSKIEICTARPTPEDKVIEAAFKAIDENPSNAPIHRVPAGVGVDPNGPVEMAALTEKRWKTGRRLKVKFVEGDAEVKRKVEAHAKEWEKHANLKLDFVQDGEAEIRISFQPTGSWSYLGTDALVIEPDRPTMNYGWLTPGSNDNEYSRVVLHEFGHAFACIHEHQHPEAGIPWDEEKVYRYYELTNGWSRAKTKRNVIDRYSGDITNFSAFDPTSIMQYSVPQELTVGDFSVGWNRVLSDTDRRFIGVLYPRSERDPNELVPGGAIETDIGVHGEEDRFTFELTDETPRRWSIETRGETDVVMGLYGPDDETRLIASDDDSGQAFNARIVRSLGKGRYTVRVRHYFSWGTGSYTIRLQPAP